jgi:putative endonuclease
MKAETSPNSRRTFAQRQGDAAEDLALAYLQARGMSLIARNVRFKAGELDLVMRQGQTIVFVEVRHRAPSRYGTAADSVGPIKQRKIARAANLWLQNQRFAHLPACRFDVIAHDGNALQWIPNAFMA